MIANCLVVLAVVSQISAFKYNQDPISYIKPEQSVTNSNFKYSYQSAPAKEKYQKLSTASGFESSPSVSNLCSQNQNLGIVRPAITSAPVTRNLVARGKYPVALQSCGPAPDKKIPVVTSHVRVPVQEKPTVRLQTKIPQPKTIAHSCTCFKTIVKPRVQQHLITVPTVQRYIETMHRPVIENIHYEAYPVRCLESADEEVSEEKEKPQVIHVQSVDASGISGIHLPSQVQNEKKIQTFEFPSVKSFEFPKMQTEKTQLIEIPRIQFAEDGKSQGLEIPRVQFIQNKNAQAMGIPQGIELPRVQFIESQKSEPLEIPRTQFLESKKPQIVEISNAQFVENNKAETIELPQLKFLQAQKLQSVEIPRIQEESQKIQTVEIPHQSRTITLDAPTPFTYQFNR